MRWRSNGPAVTGASDGLAGIPASRRPVRHDRAATRKPASITWCWPACSAPSCCAAALVRLAVRRRAARHPRERGQDRLARLQHAALQDRGRRDFVRPGRPGRRAVCAVRRLRQHRAAVLAVVRPGADHGHRRRPGHPGRSRSSAPRSSCCVQQRAQRLHRFVGAVLRGDLHLLRAVRARRHLGNPGRPPAARSRA